MITSSLLNLKTTSLYSLHKELGAKIVPFAGYQMPVSYPEGIIKEHIHTRNEVSLFDISHMGLIQLEGLPVVKYIETLAPSNLVGLKRNHQCYSFFLNERGGIIDDFVAMNTGKDYRLVVNAGNTDLVVSLLNSSEKFRNNITLLEKYSMIALQGPKSGQIMKSLKGNCEDMSFMDVRFMNLVGIECLVARSGYTGEDGFEIVASSNEIETLARNILEFPSVAPAGLGARDTLRLEAGLCLHGNDIGPAISPIEAKIAWAIPPVRRKGGTRSGGFSGSKRIFELLEFGASKYRVGLLTNQRIPVRSGTQLWNESKEEIGTVTSGAFAPSLGKPIGMGYVLNQEAFNGNHIHATIRGKRIDLHVTSLPFMKTNYYRA